MKINTHEELDLQIREKAEQWDSQANGLPFDKENLWAKIESQKVVTPVLHHIRKYVIAASIAILLGASWGVRDFVSDTNCKALAQNSRIVELEHVLAQQESLLVLQPKEMIVHDTIVQTRIIKVPQPAVANVQYEEQLRVYEESIAVLRAQNVELSELMRRQIDCLSDSLQQQSDYITQLQGEIPKQTVFNGLTLASNANVQMNQVNTSPSIPLNRRARLEVQIFAKSTGQTFNDSRSLLSKEIKL